MTARETLVTTLTSLLAVSRRGRMDAHRAEAERLVDEAFHESTARLMDDARQVMGPRTLPSGEEPERIARYVAGWHDAVDHIDPRCPGCGNPKDEGAHGLNQGYGGCV
ncbi:hypothetical protein [Streptomyces longwoodensis]|uniref:hypothetical protein n=1 Tax=Streptomyces longwoodensis TaxID=68231 RepID=UPI003408F3BA